ncbi:g2455 [Coccomyxa elongata]
MAEYVGRTVWKYFSGYDKPFKGTVTEYDEAAQFWSVSYDDGDQEELSEDELQDVLVDPGKAGPSGVGAQAKRRARKKLLQPQRTMRATAQALAPAAGPSSEAVKGKRALRSPAATAAERHAKKQKQDGRKHKLDGDKLEKRFSFASKQQGHAVAKEEKQENPLKNDGSGADEIFIPLEMSAIIEDEAAETDDKAAPALKQGDNMAADRDDWGGGEKAASPGSPTAAATQRKRQAKEKKHASPKKAPGTSGGAKAPTIRRGAPTSGPLEGPTRFHNHVVYNGMAYIAGQTAKDHSVQDYAAQTEQVLQALDEQLEAAGSSRKNLLKANVLLKDIAQGVDIFNAIWEKWIDPKHAPARMTYQAQMVHPELLVEVDAFAAVQTRLDGDSECIWQHGKALSSMPREGHPGNFLSPS